MKMRLKILYYFKIYLSRRILTTQTDLYVLFGWLYKL